MTKPKRIQRKRTKGWRLPANTVCVTRPSVFGNPFVAGEMFDSQPELDHLLPLHIVRDPVYFFDNWISGRLFISFEQRRRANLLYRLHELRGKNLACWCKLDQPCHADVLLELANQ